MEKWETHGTKRSKAIGEWASKRMKRSAMWTTGTKTNSNLDFDHPGDEEKVDLPKLWELQKSLPDVTVTRRMLDIAIASIWDKHILSQPEIDFRINKYDKVMREYDIMIAKCKRLNYKADMEHRIKSKHLAKQHYWEARDWCISYFLRNHKQAIQCIKYENKRYIAYAGVRETDGKIHHFKLDLDDEWFELQAVPGLQERIRTASKHNEYVLVDQYSVSRKDQVVLLKFKPKRRGSTTEGHFVGKNADDQEFNISFDMALANFSQVIIDEAIKKSTFGRRRYVSIPPGNSSKRDTPTSTSTIRVAFRQFNKDICAWASTASALHACGYEELAVSFFTHGWLPELNFSWKHFQGLLNKLLPQHVITIKKSVTIESILEEEGDALFQILQVVDSFGNDSHCIAATSGVIFDSNEKYGLQLTRENIDRCVTNPSFPCKATKFKKVITIHNMDNSLCLLNRLFVSVIRAFYDCGDTISAHYFQQYFSTKSGIRKKTEQTGIKQCVNILKRLVNQQDYKTFNDLQVVDYEKEITDMSLIHEELFEITDTNPHFSKYQRSDVVALIQVNQDVPEDITISVYLLDIFIQNIMTNENKKTKIITNIKNAKTTEKTSMQKFITIKRAKEN